jgi:hypothetical protein
MSVQAESWLVRWFVPPVIVPLAAVIIIVALAFMR